MHGFDEAPSSINLFALDSSFLTNVKHQQNDKLEGQKSNR